ncbi:atypical chemokine receptor 4 [Colossoma macropomum]|uniref:atypical chemokine receptor 4 n=1 Tax=Colossoma macropomum TaxID=42526 RepID=UPI001864F537|nr:atypical chemokine receptor 4 [Colossoma macropomum]XP_036453322.1 atypical chemokine receptor 4 [Colossoma macropomum]XP_036453324.1 atypical chemokine receptor 4 [Colossoma macropomum]XP_036453325.1 atypical chemokine receptor 4 [Colossoma macropomum]
MAHVDEEYYDYENVSYSFSYDDYQTICEKHDVRSFAKIFVPVMYGLCLVVGIAGNVLVVAVYTCSKRLKTLTDTFLVHLAVADILLLLTLPFWASAAVQGWELGNVLCKLVTASYTINFTCGMLLLACISLDRYLALTPGLREGGLGKAFRKNHSAKLCIVVWTIALLLGIPDLVLSTVKEFSDRKMCIPVYTSDMAFQAKVSMEVLEILLGFLVPLIVMLYCYAHVARTLLKLPPENREKRWRPIRVLLAVVLSFVLTQLPYNAVKFYRVLDVTHVLVTHCGVSKALDRAAQVTESLALTHCCLNPVLYAFIGSSFRQHIMKFAKSYGQKRRSGQRREYQGTEIAFNTNSNSQEIHSFSI